MFGSGTTPANLPQYINTNNCGDNKLGWGPDFLHIVESLFDVWKDMPTPLRNQRARVAMTAAATASNGGFGKIGVGLQHSTSRHGAISDAARSPAWRMDWIRGYARTPAHAHSTLIARVSGPLWLEVCEMCELRKPFKMLQYLALGFLHGLHAMPRSGHGRV